MKHFNAFFVFICCVMLFACTQTSVQQPKTKEVITQNNCGEPFPVFDWLEGSSYAYEILDKRIIGGGYKVKILKEDSDQMIHIAYARNISTPEEAFNWIRKQGYEPVSYTTANNPDSRYKIISRGFANPIH